MLCIDQLIIKKSVIQKIMPPPGRLEPSTFRLTAERASRLRHEGLLKINLKKH